MNLILNFYLKIFNLLIYNKNTFLTKIIKFIIKFKKYLNLALIIYYYQTLN